MTCGPFQISYYSPYCDISKFGEGCEECVKIFSFKGLSVYLAPLLILICASILITWIYLNLKTILRRQ